MQTPEIKGEIVKFKFDPSTLPPTFDTHFEIECGIDEFDVTLHYYISFPPHPYSLSWVKNAVLSSSKATIKHHLEFDRQIHRLLASMMSGNPSATLTAQLHIYLYHEMLGNYLEHQTQEIPITYQEMDAAFSGGKRELPDDTLKPVPIGTPQITAILSALKSKGTLYLTEKIVSAIYETIKEDIMSSTEFKKISEFEPVVKMIVEAGFNINWAKTAIMLSLHEVVLKKWLLNHGIQESKVKGKQFYDLIDTLNELLIKNGIEFRLKDLSRLSGDRIFRNSVLHDGYSPKPDEAVEVEKETQVFLDFLQKHDKDIKS